MMSEAKNEGSLRRLVRPRIGQTWYFGGVRPDTITRISRTRSLTGRTYVWIHLEHSMTLRVRELFTHWTNASSEGRP